MQNRIPIMSSLWPSTPRNETEERSGSFRLASPPASEEGCANAEALKVMTERIAATVVTPCRVKRHPRDTRSASQVRIGNPPLIQLFKDDYGFRCLNRQNNAPNEPHRSIW